MENIYRILEGSTIQKKQASKQEYTERKIKNKNSDKHTHTHTLTARNLFGNQNQNDFLLSFSFGIRCDC